MANSSDALRPGHQGRPFASAILYPSVFLTAAFAGCASQALRWPEHAGGPVAARPAGVRAEPAAPARPAVAAATPDSGLRRTAAPPAADEAPTPPPPPSPPPPAVPAAAGEYPIDLTTALRLAEVENPQIAEARQRIGEALAFQQGARALLLPNLNAGANYHNHQGNLQRSSGRILKLDEKSLYVGGGADASAAGPAEVPAVSIVSQLTEAIFEPLAARQLVTAATFEASATANQVLLEVASLHFELLAAEADLKVRRETAAQGAELARLTRAYAAAQQGRAADAERAATELALIDHEALGAEEAVAVASTRLARRLHLDPTVRVRPVAPVVEEVTLVDPAAPVAGLIRSALRRRPEVGARVAATGAAETRYREERARPLLPTLALGFSGGVFGGGSNLTGPSLAGFRGRTDFDVLLYWTVRNLGAGNVSLQKRRLAEVGQAVGEQSRAVAEIRTEVSAAAAEAAAARQRVAVTTRQLDSAEKGLREDLERIRNTVGRPIEAVNSLRLLNQARVDRIRAVTDSNQAQIRLFVALGSPPPLNSPPNAPLPRAPIASPPVPPIARVHGQ